jgi:Tol biopolymer transport system component
VPLKLPSAAYQGPRVSPNGRSVAVATDDGREAIVWVYDVNTGSSIQRLTFGGKNRYPVWSADSEWVAFQSDRDGDIAVFRQRADGRGQPERLTKAEPGTQHVPYAWSPDGKTLLVGVAKNSRYSLWALKIHDRRFTACGAVEAEIPIQPVISPDGQWIAYQSNETGSNQLFVQPFPEGGAKYMVPAGRDNHHPAWSPDGKALTYIPSQGVSYLVDVTTSPQFAFGTPRSIERAGRVEVRRKRTAITTRGRAVSRSSVSCLQVRRRPALPQHRFKSCLIGLTT